MSEQTPKYQAEVKNQLALIKKDVVDVVTGAIRQYQENGQLHLPVNYSPENAMKTAWLTLQETVDKDKKPALSVCTKDSIANALLDMVVQGLNPAKRQGYFIVYGNKLVFQRSYFGTMTLAKRVDDTIQDVFAEVVYADDTFKYRINRGKKGITEHEQSLENVDGKKIKAAYCVVVDQDGQIRKTEIMTFDEIKQAWRQSQIHPVDENGNIKLGSTHDKFTAEMCKKTVINKCCKPIINSSNDSHLFRQSVNRSEEVAAEAALEEEIAENANKEALDIECEVKDVETEPADDAQEQAPPKLEQKAQPDEPGQKLFPDEPGF